MFNRVVVAVVGSSNSGKTTAVEALIKGLTAKGYTVASVKHIPEPEFTIDIEGKDTWRHAKAGASTVLSVAPNELATIKKADTSSLTLEQIISQVPDETDIVIVEGFKTLVRKDMNIPKIVAAKTETEVSEALNRYKNVIAFVGKPSVAKTEVEVPFFDPKTEPEKLVNLVEDKVSVLVERKRKREEKISIQIDEKFLPLGEFVQDIVRNTVLAMVGSLKGAEITGDEKVKINIKKRERG